MPRLPRFAFSGASTSRTTLTPPMRFAPAPPAPSHLASTSTPRTITSQPQPLLRLPLFQAQSQSPTTPPLAFARPTLHARPTISFRPAFLTRPTLLSLSSLRIPHTPTPHTTTMLQQVRTAYGNTYQPSQRKRKRKHGFLVRLKGGRLGRGMLARRRMKGRRFLSH